MDTHSARKKKNKREPKVNENIYVLFPIARKALRDSLVTSFERSALMASSFAFANYTKGFVGDEGKQGEGDTGRDI